MAPVYKIALIQLQSKVCDSLELVDMGPMPRTAYEKTRPIKC